LTGKNTKNQPKKRIINDEQGMINTNLDIFVRVYQNVSPTEFLTLGYLHFSWALSGDSSSQFCPSVIFYA
jgi:hypothetical protein